MPDNKSTPTEERNKLLSLALDSINKKHGRGAVMHMSERAMSGIKCIPTGSLGLDRALGIGGVPRGRIVEIFGTESAGKSTLALSIIAQTHKMGGEAAYVDTEHALDPDYAQNLGVKRERMLISQPDSAEQALDIVEQLVKSSALDVVVLDSVAALVPSAELEGDMGNVQIGAQARLMSQAMRKLTGAISKTNTVAIFINQLREKVGVMFGNPEVTPGGRALKFYASVRIDLRRIESIKSGDEVVGNRVGARVVKNKVAPPFRKAELEVMFNEGISKESELLHLGVMLNVITKRGAFYSLEDTRLGQGKEAAKKFLLERTAFADKIENAVKLKLGMNKDSSSVEIGNGSQVKSSITSSS